MNTTAGPVIRKLRRQLGVKTGAFAQDVECSRQHLTNIETGYANPSIELLNRIARRLGVEADELKAVEEVPQA